MSEVEVQLPDGRQIQGYKAGNKVYLPMEAILPDVTYNFNTDLRRGPTYWHHEKKVLTPALEAAGLKVLSGWWSTDGDSFGPLVRGVETDKGIVTYA